MEEHDQIDASLQENLLSFRIDTLTILVYLCLGFGVLWFAMLLTQVTSNAGDYTRSGPPWVLFAVGTGMAFMGLRYNKIRLARGAFFFSIVGTPTISLFLLPGTTQFMSYSLVLAVIIAGILYSPRAPFTVVALVVVIFVMVGIASALNFTNHYGSITQFITTFTPPSVTLMLAALTSWLATRDLVATVEWAMESHRLAERRAERLRVSEARVARTLLELEGAYEMQSRLNSQLQVLNKELEVARTAADEANTLKTRFLANMSHELRTPLNAIINFTQFLGKPRYGDLTARQIELQERVLVNSEHLLGLINDILDLSKIEAGRMELHLELLDLQPIFNGVMATAVGLTKSKGLNLESDVEEEIPPVRGDKVRVRQILLNLLSNAAKFTDSGGITLRAFESDGMVQISVIDTGAGIPAHELPLVFEEFHQVEQAASAQRQQGTGLGLPISRHLVELQGGTMWAESQFGSGSSFSFTLPIAENLTPEVVIFDPQTKQTAL
ncbi:ATP-binding protein [Herpetosiphon gulosus]|uniref:histidine kinase n=1 Tax=Herpetosiphon gulosus TaxID=1973496 RepID=A0ABP9X2E3_9CHLR